MRNGLTEPRDLQLSQDLQLERRTWRAQRVVWLLMLLVIVAALLGLLGDAGPMNNASLGSGNGLVFEYHPFVRFGTPTALRITVHTPADADGKVRLVLQGKYWLTMRVDQVTPQPVSVRAGRNELVYEFALTAAGAAIAFDVVPQEAWLHSGRVGLAGGQTLEFWQFVYP